jgi:hypothetical protein
MLFVFCPMSIVAVVAPYWTSSAEMQGRSMSVAASLWKFSVSDDHQDVDICGHDVNDFEECDKIHALRLFTITALLLSLASGMTLVVGFSQALKPSADLRRKLSLVGASISAAVLLCNLLSIYIATSVEMTGESKLNGAGFVTLRLELLFVSAATAVVVCTLTRWSTKIEAVTCLPPRIGIDLGGVLNQHNNDIVGDTRDWHQKSSSEAPGALAAVRELVRRFGAKNVFIVSKVSRKMEILSETWLHKTMDICGQTGLLKSNIHFCRDCVGSKGKGPVAAALQLSHFVDDKDENLWSVFEDPAGNSREAIERHNGQLFHFARSGLAELPPPEHKWRRRPACVVPVANWQQLMEKVSWPASLPGAIAPLGEFDPLQICMPNQMTESEVRRLRKAEVTQGRVATLAFVGSLVGEALVPRVATVI